MESKKVEASIGRNVISLETGKIAKQADGAVLIRSGDTVVLCTAVQAAPWQPVDFFPLRADYREMTYAAGKFPGGFFKREGRPTAKEILTSRLMDRPIRPLFPKGFRQEVAINAVVLSADLENDPDVLSMVGASAALMLAPETPFLGPTGSVRVAKVGDEFIINPTHEERKLATLALIVSGTEDAIAMIEGFCQEAPEEDVLKAIETAKEAIAGLCRMQRELCEAMGVQPATFEAPAEPELLKEIDEKYFDRLLVAHQVRGKFARVDALKAVRTEAVEEYVKEDGPTEQEIRGIFEILENKACRKLILEEGKREDGRGMTDVRPITCEVGVLPRTHGSALFTRGETQALVISTLGTSSDEQRVDGLEDEYKKKFMLHYNFPSWSVGEAKPSRGPGRREIGHGHLAEMSLEQVMPSAEEFPYTVRIVSEITESNGSSSMASVCGGTLCMMDAGIPLVQPVAGVAMGMVTGEGKTCILTDICGSEDHYGDMDLKIAGTQNGITAIQMDLKVTGISQETLAQAFAQAREGRIHILRCMLSVLPQPREEVSRHAPRLLLIKIPQDKIGMIIGPGGKMIKKIQETSGATIDIEDDGTVNISCRNVEGAEQARSMIESITEEPVVGRTYLGKVTGIKDFGVFVEIIPGRDGLVHISELSDSFVQKVEDVCKMGDEMEVKILSIDDQGKIRLSRKVILKEKAEAEAKSEEPKPETPETPETPA